MYVIIGLGNPGREYVNTRHNMGYLALDVLAQRHNIDICRHNYRAVFGEGYLGGSKAVLAKPETFMNNSGWSAMDFVNWYKCEHDQLILLCDDIDIPCGTIRVRPGGSAGTHNGMRSVIYQLGFDDFPRVRIGIGRADGQKGLIAHVLSAPDGEEAELVKKALQEAADAVELIVKGELGEAQARYNKRPKKPKQEKPETQEKGDSGAEQAPAQTQEKEEPRA